MAKTVSQTTKTPNLSAAVDALDGGAAPGTQAGIEPNLASGANNGGTPSAELLAAIAAEGGGPTPAVSAGGLDGDAAPSE
jgi:hypothetical protein